MSQKIQSNDSDVMTFLNKFKDEVRYKDLLEILKIMSEISGEPAKLWGKQMIGFGNYNYKTKTSEGTWFLTGFSPRKNNISLYIMAGFEKQPQLIEQLGNYKTGKSCLYINRLSDVNIPILKKLISESIKMKNLKHK